MKRIYARGRKPVSTETIKCRVEFTKAQNIPCRKWLRKLIPDDHDCRAIKQNPGLDDQNPCGNCYEHSGCEVCAVGQLVAGVASQPFGLSAQYMLDNFPRLGGCNGGDEWEVAQQIMQGRCPSTSQYIGPGQSPGSPQDTSKMVMYKIVGMGYADPSSLATRPRQPWTCRPRF